MKILYNDEYNKGFKFNEENGKYYNDSLGININSWNGKVNFDELFYTNEYEEFSKKLVKLLEYINSLSSYCIDFGERVETNENNSTSK